VTLLGQAFAHTILPQIQPHNKPTAAATSGAYYNITSSMWIPELESDEGSTATKQSKGGYSFPFSPYPSSSSSSSSLPESSSSSSLFCISF
jgi:hypothetical protein